MGERGEIFSTRLFADEGKKTFFFNVKENRFGDRYLNIAESRKMESGSFRRSSIIIFEEHISDFTPALEGILSSSSTRRGPSSAELVFDGGRRTYNLKVEFRKQKELVISELKSDDQGKHRERIVIPGDIFITFLSYYREALAQVLQ